VNDRDASITPTSPEHQTPEWATAEELLELSKALSSTLDLHLLLRKIDDSAVRLTGAVAGSIMLFDEDRKSLHFRSLSGEESAMVKPSSVRDGMAWWAAQHGEVVRVDDVTDDQRFTGTIDKITGFRTKSILCVPVTLEGEIIGVIEVLNKTDRTGFTDDDERLLSVLASQAAVAVRNARLATEQRNFFVHVIEILVTAIESTLLVPEGHCWRVAKLAIAVGRKLRMESQELRDLYYGAALHDLGVLSLRQSEIEKGGRAKSHPILGASMVRAINMLHNTEPIVRHHHEYFDGSGYPDGLKGEEIPLSARVIGVVEAYEEAISEGQSQDLARAEIQNNSGKLFDPAVVDAFLELATVNE
jgi:HD-GYP domain-containing protein (c-di-GMP phosphodiesterase class II)